MRPCVALRMWATMCLLWIGKRRTMSATGDVRALCASTSRRTPGPSKNAMPKPSLCSSARVEKPVKLNITSVGVLAFMPSSWHIAASSTALEQQPHPGADADQAARHVGFLEHAAHALQAARAAPCAPGQQIDQPRMGVDRVRLLVDLVARLQCDDTRGIGGAHRGVAGLGAASLEQRFAGEDAGLERLADALAG